MKYRSLFETKDIRIYLALIGVMSLILLFFKPVVGAIAIGILAFLIIDYVKALRKTDRKWIEYVESLSGKFDSVTKHAVFNMPFPLVILEEDGKMTWYNTQFKNMMTEEMEEEEEILNKPIKKFISKLDLEEIFVNKENRPIQISHGEKHYKVHYNVVEDERLNQREEDIAILYWVDDTDYIDTKNTLYDESLVTCLAYIDNYSEVKNTTPEETRPLVMAEIDSIINNYTLDHNGMVRKYENDKYLLIFERKDIDIIQERKFDILDEIRAINKGNTIPVTMSLGVGIENGSPFDSYNAARAAIDITLGRGGDQAVVKEGENISFYGGKTKAIEKSNKVKSRVISHALRQLIDQSDNIFIMGHRGADMDSFGASIGILRAVLNRGKEGFIVLDDVNPAIENIYEKMTEEQSDYLRLVIDKEEAERRIKKSDLLVVLDNHKPNFTEAPELLDYTERVVVIDHHRRGAEFIENPILTYLEPYASSTCELITEILFYMEDKLNMEKFDANALLAGITVDTKNFTFQTGVRTFEAASILKRAGADTTEVRQLFRDDFNTFLYKAEVVSHSKIVFEKIAIGRLEKDMEDSVLIAAQGANDLLNINGIEASFVMTLSKGRIHISGRSLGDISVQLILEKLGGGGHLTSAGTQLDMSIDEAEEALLKAIEEYLAEGDDD